MSFSIPWDLARKSSPDCRDPTPVSAGFNVSLGKTYRGPSTASLSGLVLVFTYNLWLNLPSNRCWITESVKDHVKALNAAIKNCNAR